MQNSILDLDNIAISVGIGTNGLSKANANNRSLSSAFLPYLCEELNEALPAIAGGTCCLGPDGPNGC
ncbi:hypothetical protein PMIT1323_01856 [Prochlorococcus marinus str. MIT 1323]|nr:hypothetical protein PMIT1323_01856 [Prochlorococcus marinus str. MIT 1323]